MQPDGGETLLSTTALPVLSQHAGSCYCELPAWGSKEVLGVALPGVCCHIFFSLVAGFIKRFPHGLNKPRSLHLPQYRVRYDRRGAAPQQISSTIFKLRLEHCCALRSDQYALNVCNISWKQSRNSGSGPAPTVFHEVGLLDIRVTWDFLYFRLKSCELYWKHTGCYPSWISCTVLIWDMRSPSIICPFPCHIS